jgi:hypothetical protein
VCHCCQELGFGLVGIDHFGTQRLDRLGRIAQVLDFDHDACVATKHQRELCHKRDAASKHIANHLQWCAVLFRLGQVLCYRCNVAGIASTSNAAVAAAATDFVWLW